MSTGDDQLKSVEVDNVTKILLDAGHGGIDPGAQAEGIDESDVVLEIALALGKKIEHLLPKAEVFYTRIKNKKASLEDRTKIITDINPNAFISIHCNAIEDDEITEYDERERTEGFEIFYRNNRDYMLASAIENILLKSTLWRKNRGIKLDYEWLGKRLTVLNNLDIPSVLIEVGFLSNTREREIIIKNSIGIAELIAHGIFDFINTKS